MLTKERPFDEFLGVKKAQRTLASGFTLNFKACEVTAEADAVETPSMEAGEEGVCTCCLWKRLGLGNCEQKFRPQEW